MSALSVLTSTVVLNVVLLTQSTTVAVYSHLSYLIVVFKFLTNSFCITGVTIAPVPEPLTVMVGVPVYPVPLSSTTIAIICPELLILADIVACVVAPPPVTVTVGICV